MFGFPVEQLALGAIIAAVVGWFFAGRVTETPTKRHHLITAVTAAGMLLAVAAALKGCTFNPDFTGADRTGVDRILGWGLMASGAAIGLVVAKALLGRKDQQEESQFAGDIRARGFNLGEWVPWALLAPTLAILVVFLYLPAIQTFTLSTQLIRMGARRSIPVCLDNFSEILIGDPLKLLLYPFLAVLAIYAARLWVRRAEPGSINAKAAAVASGVAMLLVFLALYGIFSPGGGDSVKYRPVYLNTLVISTGIVFLGMAGGLALAYLSFRSIRGGTLYRTMLIWPYAISPAIAGILFAMLLDPTAGIIGRMAETWFGIDIPNFRESVVLGQASIIIASSWKILGYNILFYLAGLQTVPMDQIEAAVLDGASSWQRFRYIVLTALSPITFFLLVTNLTYAFFNVYGTIDYMTKGAPAGATSVSIYEIIRVGVDNGDLGRGAAQSVMLFLAVIAITVWQFRTSGNRVSYGGS